MHQQTQSQRHKNKVSAEFLVGDVSSLSVLAAAKPAFKLLLAKLHRAELQAQLMPHHRHLPRDQGTSVKPSGRSPSVRVSTCYTSL